MRRCIVSFRRILGNFLVFTAIFVPAFLTFGCRIDTDDSHAEYTLNFNANGGIGEMNEITVEAGSEVTISANTFSRDGWIFAGWNTKSDGTGTPHDDNAKITLTADITLYAQWAVKAENVANAINNLNEGTHNICVVGEIDETTLIDIGKALRSNENVKVNLDLSKTTGLVKIGDFEIDGRRC